MTPSDPFFKTPEDLLEISFGSETRIHRIIFQTKNEISQLNPKGILYLKLKDKIAWEDKNSVNFFKNNVFSLGLTKTGKIILYVKVKPENFAKEFIRSMRKDFCLDNNQIYRLAIKLKCRSIEVATDINDPLKSLKNAKLRAKLIDLKKEVLAFLDESMGTTEIELKGDPELTSNLNFLLKDKIQATKYFYKLTKTLKLLTLYLIDQSKRIEVLINANFLLLSVLLEIEESTEQNTELNTEQPNQKSKKSDKKNAIKK